MSSQLEYVRDSMMRHINSQMKTFDELRDKHGGAEDDTDPNSIEHCIARLTRMLVEARMDELMKMRRHMEFAVRMAAILDTSEKQK